MLSSCLINEFRIPSSVKLSLSSTRFFPTNDLSQHQTHKGYYFKLSRTMGFVNFIKERDFLKSYPARVITAWTELAPERGGGFEGGREQRTEKEALGNVWEIGVDSSRLWARNTVAGEETDDFIIDNDASIDEKEKNRGGGENRGSEEETENNLQMIKERCYKRALGIWGGGRCVCGG